jgi:DNA gyrase/topoisomerase IV subunit B
MKVTWDDIRTNLYCIVSLSTNAYVGFVGNAKNQIMSPKLVPYMKDLITSKLDEFFKANPKILEDIIKIVKINVKARMEALKAKSATQVERLNTFKEHEMSNFIRCNNTGKQWKEIFLVEGNSASGSARNGSDPNTQAFFLFRGVTANAMKCSLTEIMENKEWRDLVTVLKTGIGPKFDISKLYFDRINIFTDSDVDGYNISAGMLAFFYKYMRPVIEEGKLYKVYSPLYSLDDREHPFVANKAEMVEIYHDKIVKTYKIKLEGDDEYLSKDDLYEFLLDTYDYRENLIRASQDSGNVNKFLVEAIIAYLTMFNIVRDEEDFNDLDVTFNDQKFIKTIMNNIQKKFKEIKVDNSGRFSGVVEGKYAVVKVNRRFFRKTSELIPIYKKYGYMITVKEKGKDTNPVKMTIGEFLDLCMKLTPRIKTRFKGLTAN